MMMKKKAVERRPQQWISEGTVCCCGLVTIKSANEKNRSGEDEV